MLNSPSNTQNRNERGVNFHLPDEIMEEILTRLPAIDVVRFRSVCKKWRDLIGTQSFTLLHLKRCGTPMLAFEEYLGDPCQSYASNHYLLDQWWEPLQTTPKGYKFGNLSEFHLEFSNGGLIVMYHRSGLTYMIMNPMFHENVQITFSKKSWIDDIWGVYFHPLLDEYCTLWRIHVGEEFSNIYEYKILNLGSKPFWRKIGNPGNHIDSVGGTTPMLIDEQLYWVVDSNSEPRRPSRFLPPDILEFDIRKEEFTLIPSPVSRAHKWDWQGCNLNLLDIGGLLSLVLASPFEVSTTTRQFQVKMWTLKDRARLVWTMSSYKIDGYAYLISKPIALVNDELALHCDPVFICNLNLCTARESEYHCEADAFPTSHVMSLLSLRNCKSEIYIDEKGEVEKNK